MIATVSPRSTPADVDAVQAAGERLDHRGDLGREPRRDGEEVRPRDPLRDEDQLRVGAVQQREQVLAERLLAARAGGARAARRRVRGDHAAAGRDVDPAELVPERARRRAEQHGVPAAERLQVGAVGERDLDLDEHVAGVGDLGPGTSSSRRSPGPVEDQCPHGAGVKDPASASPRAPSRHETTFSAAPARKSSSPSSNRSSGRTVGSGSVELGRSATASCMCAGVADREPSTVSSRR